MRRVLIIGLFILQSIALCAAHAQETLRSNSLDALLVELIDKLGSPSGSESGIVVQVNGDRVFVDIGTDRGAVEGQEFELVTGVTRITHPVTGEVLDETRDVIARVRVVRAQQRLSICELIDGEPAAINADGEPVQVFRPVRPGATAVDLGDVRVAADLPLPVERVRAAAIAGINQSNKFDLKQGAELKMRFDVSLERGGTRVSVALMSSDGSRPVADASGLFIPTNALIDLRYGGAIVFDVGRLDMAVVRRVLQAEFGSRRMTPAEDGVFLERTGLKFEDIWVLPDGRVIVASLSPFSGPTALRSSEITAKTIARLVTANENIDKLYTESSSIFTSTDEQIQILYMHSYASAGFGLSNLKPTLRIGSVPPTWAFLTFPPAKGNASGLTITSPQIESLTRGERPQNKTYNIVTLVPLSDNIVKLELNREWRSADQLDEPIRWEFFFPTPESRVRLVDESGRSLIRAATYSRSLRHAGHVPMPDRLPEHMKPSGMSP